MPKAAIRKYIGVDFYTQHSSVVHNRQMVETFWKPEGTLSRDSGAAWGYCVWKKTHTGERLEAACRRAVVIGGYSYRSVKSIMEK